MARADDFMLTAEEIRLRTRKRRIITIVALAFCSGSSLLSRTRSCSGFTVVLIGRTSVCECLIGRGMGTEY